MAGAIAVTLYGPMSSWGTEHSASEVRTSADRPTKSAIIGLLGACLGIVRENRAAMAALSNDLDMMVAVIRSGSALIDYHTVESIAPKAKTVLVTRTDELDSRKGKVVTTITRRTYRQDAAYVVALCGEPDLLARLTAAMEQPVYMPFLGRKSCPLGLPLGPKPLAGHDLVAELLAYAHDVFAETGLRPATEIMLAWESGLDTAVQINGAITHVTRRDGVDHVARGYLTRQERVARVPFVEPAAKIPYE